MPRNTLHISNSSDIEISVKGTEIASQKSKDEHTLVVGSFDKKREPQQINNEPNILESADKKSMLDKLLENMTIGKESSLEEVKGRNITKSLGA